MPKYWLLPLLFPIVLSAQRVHIRVYNLVGSGHDVYLAPGMKIFVKLNNGEKMKGTLDSVYADALVMKDDTLLFDSIKCLGWKEVPYRRYKIKYNVGRTGLAAGGILIGLGALAMSSHDQASLNFGGVALSLGVPMVLISPFFLIPGYIHTHAWHKRRRLFGWRWSGTLQ